MFETYGLNKTLGGAVALIALVAMLSGAVGERARTLCKPT